MTYFRAKPGAQDFPEPDADRRTFLVFFLSVGLGVAALGVALAFGPFVALALPLALALLAAALRD